jgi:hypothetical protein
MLPLRHSRLSAILAVRCMDTGYANEAHVMLATFDMHTLAIAAGLVALFCAFPLIYVIGTRKGYPGMTYWLLATVAACFGLGLIGFQGTLPDSLSVVLANTLIVAFSVLSTQGLLSFVGRRPFAVFGIIVIGVTSALLALFSSVWPNYSARVLTICIVYVAYTVRSLMILWSDFPRLSLHRNWLLVTTFSVSVAWYAMRAALTMAEVGGLLPVSNAYNIQLLSIFLAVGANIASVSGFVIASLQRLRRDLDTSEIQVKTLSGLLPICSGCKKIRGDDGKWVHIELYIHKHSEATFSHGLCDECAAKLYPDLYRQPETRNEV